MPTFAQSSKKRRASSNSTLKEQRRQSRPSAHQRQCDNRAAAINTPRYLRDSLRTVHTAEKIAETQSYNKLSSNNLPMPPDLLRLYAQRIAAVQFVDLLPVESDTEAACRDVDESETDEAMPANDAADESSITDDITASNTAESESAESKDSRQVQEDTVEGLEEQQETQEQTDTQNIAALKPVKAEVRPEQIQLPSELPATPENQPRRTAAPAVMRAERIEQVQAERTHAAEEVVPADIIAEQDIVGEEQFPVESAADEISAAEEEGADRQADTDLALPVEEEEPFSPTDTRSIPASTTPPLTMATVSLGPVRRAIQQRAAALPTGEITAGTEAARRAQRLREQAEQAQADNADAVAASAEEAMPPVPEDLPASLLSEESPVPGIQELLREASDRTLPNQTPPRLVRTPQNNLPELGRSPVSPGTLRRLQNIDIETPPVGDREEAQRDQLLGIRRQLTTRLEVTEGEGVLPAFVDVPPPEHPVIPEGNKVQLSRALARLLENPTGEARRMVARARGSAFVGGVLNNIEATQNLGDDTMVSEFSEVLGTQLDAIRMEAGIAAEDVDAEVRKRREQLDTRRESQEREMQMSLVDERSELAEANQHVADTVAGARTAMDERAEDVQAAMGGENQRAAIEARRDRLLQDITRHVARESANYQRAGETRARELDTAERQQIAAYRFAVQQDEFQLNQNRDRIRLTEAQRERVTGGVDPVQFRIQELVAESNSWLQERIRIVRSEFRTMKGAASTWTTSNKNTIQSAGENTRQQIRDWASEQLGEETSWWDELMAMIDDWLGQAEADADAWETVQNQETAVVASGYVDMLNQVEAAANAGITEEQMLARSNLTAEERAIIHAYFNPPPGQVGRDPIGAVAFGIRERIYRQRAGELKGRLESMVLDGSFGVSGRAHVAVLEQVGRAYTPGFNAWDRATRLHAAFYPGITGLGTEEDQVFSALASLNPVQAKAVRLAYQTEYGESLESALRSEMSSGGEINRATALLSGNQAAADAAALHMAMDETFLGTGWGTDRDVIMTTLRNKTPEQIEAIRAAYAEAYGSDISLEQKLTDELNDWATLSSHDADMAAAYMASNTELADAIALDQSLHGFSWGYAFNLAYGTSFEEGSRDEFTAVTDRIRREVAQQATANQWTDVQFQAELSRRLGRVEATYNQNFFAHGNLRQAVNERFTEGPNRNLLVATLDNDEIRADAARIAIERYGSVVYASDDVIIETLERRYTRALEAVRLDLGPQLRQEINTRLSREDQAYFEEHGVYMTGEQRFARQQELQVDMEHQLESEARRRAQGDMQRMETVFAEEYGNAQGETLQQAVRVSTSGISEAHALTALQQGGYLDRYQRFDYAVRGGGTREEALRQAVAGATPEELAEMDARWRREHPGETLRDRALSELSGKDAMDMQVSLLGRPMTVEAALRAERLRISLEQPDNWFGEQIAGPERAIMEFRLQQMGENARRLRRPITNEAERRARDRILDEFAFNQEAVQAAVQQHRARVSAITDAIANTASMVVAVAVGAVLTFVSGGLAGPIAAALIASLAATMTSIGTRMVLMGNQYGQEEFMTDAILGVVDAIVAAATAGIGNRLLGISQIARAAGGSTVRTGVRGTLQSIQRRLAGMLARMGSIGPLAQRTQASRLLQSMARGPWYKKLAAHAIAESVENAVGAFPTAVVATVIDDRNWQGGFQFGNALASIGTQVGMGVGMGLAMSGGMAGAGHLLSGARHLVRGPRLGSDLHFSTPDHLPTNDAQYRAALESYLGGRHPDGTPRTQFDFDLALQRERQRHLDNFLSANPGKTEADFNARLQSEAQARRTEFEEMHRGRPDQDFDVEAGREAGEQIQKIDQQRRERQQYVDEIAAAAPEGRRGDFNEIPVSVLSDAEFTRITGRFSGDSAVIVRDGQAHLVVRQGAEPASVRQQAAHLAEITAPGTRGRVKDPTAALPTDLRGRVNVEVNPDLPARSVQVHYESHNGIIVGVWMEIGPGAHAVDIQMHANTVRSMRRLQGISGRIRRLIERMRRWARLNPSPPPGTRAFEARLEMEKLPAIISERANALRNAATPEEQVRLMMEVEHLQAQMESHARFVDAVETEPGIGYVAAEDLSKRQVDNKLKKIDDPQARSILSGLEYEEQKQFLHYFDLVNEVTAGHVSPRQVTDSLNSLLDSWRSLRAVADEIDDTLMPRLMNKALNADDKAGFLQNTRRIVEALDTADSQQIIRDIGYMVDAGGVKGRVEDFLTSANRLLDAELPREISATLLQSAVGVPERVRLLDGINRLAGLTDDPAVLRAIAERLNGGNGRSPMSPENRADFVEGTARMIDAVERLANDYPQYRDLLPGFMQGAVETHLTGKYFQAVDEFLTTVRNYTESKNAKSVRDITARLDSSRFDPDIANIIDEAMAGPAADHPVIAGKRSVADLMDAIGAADANRELGAIARTLDVLTTRSIGDPDLGVRVRPAIEEITRILGEMDMQQMPPHLQAKMREIIDRVREFNKSASNIDTIFPGERRIPQELYDELRGKTPSKEIRDRVNRDEHGNPLVPPYPDPVLPGMTVEGALHADHIVSMDSIARMDGFERLTTEQKLSILNDERNFVGLSESANTSKGPKSFADWTEHKASGTPVDPQFRAKMIREEARLRRILQERIDELVAQNNS